MDKKRKYIAKENQGITVLVILSLITSLLLVIIPRQFQDGQALFLPKDISVGVASTKEVVTRRPLVYENVPATQALMQEKEREAPPVFSYNNTVPFQVKNTLSVIAKALAAEELFDARLFILEEIFSPTEITYLQENSNKLPLFPLIGEFIDRMLQYGILSDHEEQYYAGVPSIIVEESDYFLEADRERIIDKDYLFVEDVPEAVGLMVRGLGITSDDEAFISFIIQRIIEPNLFYNSLESAKIRNAYRNSVEPVITNIPQGTVVIQKGEVIGVDTYHVLQAIKDQGSQRSSLFQYLGLFAYVVLFYFLGFQTWGYAQRTSPYFIQRRNIIIISLLLWQLLMLLCYMLGARAFYDYYIFFVPTVTFVVGVSIFAGSQEAVLFALFLGGFQVLMPDTSLLQGVVTIGFGLSGAYFLRAMEKRIDIVKMFYKIIFFHMGFAALFMVMEQESLRTFLIAMVIVVGVNSVWFVLFVFLLPFIEKLSNIPTVFRLQELADMSLPIFQRMRHVAPGTYSHSLAVSELAEAAAMEIGANKYIAKVGACYHDIGKLDQPEYFIENQQSGANKHDALKPTLSVSIIKAHVKLGEQKAKELGLPQEVIDIISQHHGNGTIAYFYYEAMKAAGITHIEALREEGNFRYNGTPPKTKEGAIVMLADSVEAISRTMKQPSSAKIEKMIWRVITDKISQDQLSGCALTMKELKAIKASFLATTLGRFHGRILYPGQQEEFRL